MIFIDVLFCWISIMLIVFVLIPLYNKYRIDAFRQKLFQLRGELFDWANEGNISFDNSAYITLRERINMFIRFTHHITLIRLILVSIVLDDEENINKMFQEKLKGIEDRGQKKVIISYYRRLTAYTMKHIISSPACFSIMVASAPFVIVILFRSYALGRK